MKVRFLEDYTVKADNGPTYRAGEVIDLPAPSVRHFMRKNRVELAVFGPAESPAAPVLTESPANDPEPCETARTVVPRRGRQPKPVAETVTADLVGTSEDN